MIDVCCIWCEGVECFVLVYVCEVLECLDVFVEQVVGEDVGLLLVVVVVYVQVGDGYCFDFVDGQVEDVGV